MMDDGKIDQNVRGGSKVGKDYHYTIPGCCSCRDRIECGESGEGASINVDKGSEKEL